MVKGEGSLISETTEAGVPIPFLTTQEILQQLSKFGFIIKYDLKNNLPGQVISYLSELYNLHFDKINVVNIRTSYKENGYYVFKPQVIVMKSCEATVGFMKYEETLTQSEFNELLNLNVVMNVTDEPGMVWDWVTHLFNIADILDENIDPTDDYETKTDIQTGDDDSLQVEITPEELIPEGYSPYTGELVEDGEDG